MITGLKRLSKEDIELKAEQIFKEWFPEYLVKPKTFPYERFCKKIETEYSIKVTLDANLGHSSSGQPILGAFSLQPREIFVDASIRRDRRFLFVLGHEIGHLILHRHLKFDEAWNNRIQDTGRSTSTQKELKTPLDWMEWQANTFATSILMPRATFKIGLGIAQNRLGLSIKPQIVVTNHWQSQKVYEDIVAEMARHYFVPKISIRIRLKELGLVTGPGIDAGHISSALDKVFG